MYYKVITCPCYADVIMEREFGNENIVKRLLNFHCNCNVPHDHKVWVCVAHPIFCTPSVENLSDCSCRTCSYYEVWPSCIEKHYLVNFRANTFCFKTYFRVYAKTNCRF